MFENNYRPANDLTWQGRVDSTDNFDAFRWHQWVKPLDLRDGYLSPYKGKLGFAFIGFCCDEGVKRNKGRIGASKGPKSIRKEMSNFPCTFYKDVQLFDAGDILCLNNSLEDSQAALGQAVNRILDLNLFPIILGGGHETTFGHYKGVLSHLCSKKQSPNIGIVNFDAHFDLRPYPNGGSSGTMFRQISDICKDKNLKYSYFCLGVQQHSNTIELFKTANKLGVNYVLAKDISNTNNWHVLEQLDEFIRKQNHIYITICSDVFSSAFAPGVSATQSLGLEPEKVLNILKYLLRSNKVISFDICEVSPRFDHDNNTANLAAVMIFSVVTTLCSINQLSL